MDIPWAVSLIYNPLHTSSCPQAANGQLVEQCLPEAWMQRKKQIKKDSLPLQVQYMTFWFIYDFYLGESLNYNPIQMVIAVSTFRMVYIY